MTLGVRLPDGTSPHQGRPGCYWRHEGIWYCEPPSPTQGATRLIGNLAAHDVVEHEDGTITVTPSILIRSSRQWHGYLTRGIWQEC